MPKVVYRACPTMVDKMQVDEHVRRVLPVLWCVVIVWWEQMHAQVIASVKVMCRLVLEGLS